jgi:ElaB/YqjD/DUF883 family membrane-anchored ribosome-binding protein
MPKITPEEFVEKHARRLKGAVEDIRKGVERVTTSPGQLAAQKEAKFKAQLNAAIDQGIWKQRVSKVTVDEWKRKTVEKGLGRIASGIDASADKVRDFAQQLLPYQDGVLSKVKTMPDITLEDRINRMTTWVREMAKFRKK